MMRPLVNWFRRRKLESGLERELRYHLERQIDEDIAAGMHPKEARQAALRSDEAGEKLASAQIEGGYWLAPLEDAANHWAVESARLQLTAYEAGQAAHGAGRAIEFAKRDEPWRPANVEEDIKALIAAQRALAR